jgi:Right handed beta helix region
MRYFHFSIVLLLALPAICRGETNVCTRVFSGDTISQPGSYCLLSDVTAVPGPGATIAVRIIDTHDITLDCNGYNLGGGLDAPDGVVDGAVTASSVGLYIGSSERVTVRNCTIFGWGTAVFVGRTANGQPRSRDIVVEDNVIHDAAIGMSISAEGSSRVSGNVITDSMVQGIEVFGAPGQMVVSRNTVIRVGDTTWNPGQGGGFGLLGGWLIVEDNLFSDVVAPTGTVGSSAVVLSPGSGVGLTFSGNRILAPVTPADKGVVTVGIDNAAGNGCEGNLIVGYGTTPIANCPLPSNEQR